MLAAAAAPAADEPDHVIESLRVEGAHGAVDGRIDWTGGTLTVTGEGVAPEGVTNPVQRRLLGFRAARVVGYRALLEVVGGVQIDGATTVSMTMVSSDSVRSRVEGVVRGARIVPGSQREENGLYRLDLTVDLRGELADAVLPDSVGSAQAPPPRDLPAQDSLLVFTPPRPYTGLVIDARGTALRPSLSPRIVDDGDRVIYSADHVSRDYAVHTGIVGYDRNLARAVSSDRVRGTEANPMIVDAVGAAGPYGSDVVVTRDMGTRIRMADMEGDFLSRCRVVFVVGPRPAPAPESGDSAAAVPARTGDLPDSALEARRVGGGAAAGSR